MTATNPRAIRMSFSTMDGFRESRSFKTLAGAKKYFTKRMGTAFDISSWGYAINAWGDGKLTISGATWTELLGYDPVNG